MGRLRKILALLLAAGMLTLSACQTEPEIVEEKDGGFSNGYLGITVEVPDGWTISERNVSNMTVYPEDSARLEVLEKNYFDDGNYYMDLIEFSNSENQYDEIYVQIHLLADNYRLLFPYIKLYLSSCQNAYAGQKEDGYNAS